MSGENTKEPDYKKILLQLCLSITICDHIGDVIDNVHGALDLAGIPKSDKYYETWEEELKDRIKPYERKGIWGMDYFEYED